MENRTELGRDASPVWALSRALTAAAIMGVSLMLAASLGQLAGSGAGAEQPMGERLLVAAPVAITVTAAIVLLRRRWDRGPLTGIGLTGLRSDLPGFLLGLGVVLGVGAGVLAVLSLTGFARWDGVDAGGLLTFLLTNAVVALLWEAIPEEVSIRGYALTALRAAFGRTLATVLTLVIFMMVPLIAMATGALFDLVVHAGEVQLWLSPPGGDSPLVYYSTLAVFGLLLIYARDATTAATVWTCIGAHLAWLTVNRIVLGSTEAAQVDLGQGGTFIFLGAYTTLAIVGFSLLAQRAKPNSSG
ncbi:type II CAAX prenyl endopeptidase Rce1 family protein [Nesterenkonia muleiensis]|uniref:CPBP family glutamic-type intramembrane protease n=1 Tax=Nesterenkonia muleiensis TaxID=2282648 RepID=UPI000E71DF9D|nr:CPBP family glutamic-type intramembrane protease [Nesterenkonia muleiensis]